MLRWLEVITLELLYTKANTCINKLLEMCGIDFFLNFGSVSEKNSDSVPNEFGSVRFKKCSTVQVESSQVMDLYSASSWNHLLCATVFP